jgi:rod shape-determining protein MreC
MFLDKQLSLLAPLKSGLGMLTHPLLQATAHFDASAYASDSSKTTQANTYIRPDTELNKDATQSNLPFSEKQLREENAKLRALLSLSQQLDAPVTFAAQVISQTPHQNYHSFLIDQGLSSGVKLGQGVINTQGLVGNISEVSLQASRVMSLTDVRNQLLVENQRTGERAIAKGAGRELELLYVQPENRFRLGDLWVTTGLDKVYPAGVPVGRISQINAPVNTEFAHILLTPSVISNELDFVLLVVQAKP